MEVYTSNLYNSVIKHNLSKYTNVRVLSGYGSSSFLEKVIEDFPLTKIELYIGMAKEGISRNDHINFNILSNEKIKVFYNITNNFNHMKIYEFSNEFDKIYYIGSANFSDNGFFVNEEILVEINKDLSYIFSKYNINMMNCTHVDIEKYINLIDKESITKINRNPKKVNYKTLNDFKEKIENKFFRKFSVPIVLPSTSDLNWRSQGINKYPFNNEEPVIRQTPQNSFIELFPKEEIIYIYTYDGNELTAVISGDFYSEIKFIDFNIYKYINEKLKLNRNTPISYEQLKEKGIEEFHFVRLNETEYFLTVLNEI